MALEWQDVDIDMVGALDTKGEPRNSVQTNLDIADNVVYTKTGDVSPRQAVTVRALTQRNQILSYEGGGSKTDVTFIGQSPALNPGVTNLNTLYKCGEQVLGSDGYRMMSYNRSLNEHQIVGSFVPCVSELVDIKSFTSPINPTPTNNGYDDITVFAPESVIRGNYRITSYGYGYDNGDYEPQLTLYFTVEDIQAGTVLINSAATVDSSLITSLKLVNTSNGVALFSLESGTLVQRVWWDASTPYTYTQTAWSVLGGVLAISYNSGSDRFCTVFQNGANLEARYYVPSAASVSLVNTTTIAAGVTAAVANLAPNTAGAETYDVVYRVAADAAGVLRSARVNQALTIAPVTHAAPSLAISSTLNHVFIKQEPTTGFVLVGGSGKFSGFNTDIAYYFTLSNVTHVKDTSKAQVNDIHRFLSVGEPVVYDRQVYLAGSVLDIYDITGNAPTFSKPCLIRLSSETATSEIVYAGLIRGAPCAVGQPLVSTSLNEIYLPSGVSVPNGPKVGAFSTSAVTQTSFKYAKISFAKEGVVGSYVEYNGGTVIAGGYPKFYDRTSLTELGFLGAPSITGLTTVAAIAPRAGNIISGSTYSWYAVYVWTDANGREHRSRPSPIRSLTGGAGTNAAQLQVLKPAISSKYRADATLGIVRDIYTEIYRTAANQSGPFYLSMIVPADGDGPSDPGGSITIRDDIADSELTSSKQIYTTGGVLSNETPPPMSSVCVYADRLFGINSETNRIFYFKSGTTQDFGAYSSALEIKVGNPAEKLTAAINLDQNIFAFTETRTYMANGLPANDQGAGATIDSFLPLASEVGCPYPKSIVQFAGGLLLYTLKGFYVIDRGGGSQYIGAPMENLVGGYVCSGASLVYGEGTWQARFMMTTPGRGDSFIACYDTFFNKWSRHLYSDSAVGGDLVWTDGFLWISGVVPGLSASFFQEFPPRTNTANENITCTIRTGWIAPFGRQHQGKIRRISMLGEFPGTGTDRFTVTVETNFGNPALTGNTTTSENFDIVAGGGIYPLGSTSTYRLRMRMVSQRAESFRVQVVWRKSSLANNLSKITAISAEVGAKSGPGKLPLTQTMNNT